MTYYFWLIVIVLSLFIIFLIFRLSKQQKRINNIRDTLEDIVGGQDHLNIYTEKNDSIGQMIYVINSFLTLHREQKQNYQKEKYIKKQLLSNLSHDVRTPLVSVIGYIEAVIQNRVEDSKKQEYITTSYNKALLLKDQINQLFELVQSDADEIELHIEKIDICELIREAVIDLLPVIEKDKIQLEMQFPDLELFIEADNYCVTRICQNLIRNALIHGNAGKYLGIFVGTGETYVHIDVIDRGIGIPQEHIPFVFDRLYKVDNARTKGSGIGLAIAKELANKMEGNIEVLRSIPGDTDFRITFKRMKIK